MSLSSKLVHALQSSLKVEAGLNALRRVQTVNRFKNSCVYRRNLIGSQTYIKRVYSTNPKPSESKNEDSVASAVLPETPQNQSDVKTGEKKDATRADAAQDVLSQLKNLDEQVRFEGRLYAEQVQHIINICKKGIQSTEAAMLLRSTGDLLVKESLETRRNISELAWKKVEACCQSITTEVVNAWMAVRLENKVAFEPTEVLVKLEEGKNVPTKKTYDLLIAQYCEVGDIQGANEVLTHVKSMDWPVSNFAIHSLVRGYMKKGDVEGAQAIIENMNKQGHRPTAETYTTLMLCYAEKGNLEGIKEVMATAVNKDIKIPLRSAYNVVMSLADSGHQNKIVEAMDILVNSRLHDLGDSTLGRGTFISQRRHDYQDSLNLIFQLMAENHFVVVKDVLKKIVRSSILSEEAVSTFCMKSIISDMMRRGKSIKDLLEVREMLVAENFMTDELEPLAAWAMRLQTPAYILELFGELKNKGMVFKPHYFWPVFHKAKQSKSTEDIYKTTTSLVESTISLASVAQTTLTWSFDNLLHLGQDQQTILASYKDRGMPKNMRDVLELAHLSREGRFREIQRLIENDHQFSVRIINSNMAEGMTKENFDAKELVQLCKYMDEKMKMNLKFNAQFLLTTVNALKSTQLNEFLHGWVDSEIKFIARMAPIIKHVVTRKGVPQELIERVMKLSSTPGASFSFESPLTKDLDPEVAKVSGVADLETTKPAKQSKPKMTEEVKKKDSELVSQARSLLQKREHKDFKNLVYGLAEKGDLESVESMKSLKMPGALKDFVDRCTFMANIHSENANEFIQNVTAEEVEKSVSSQILLQSSAKDLSLVSRVEEIAKKPSAEDLQSISIHCSLYHYYLMKGELQKINELFQVHPSLKSRVKLMGICKQAKSNKNETMLRQLIDIHKDAERPWRLFPVYNSLLLLKCEASNHEAATNVYNEALSNGMIFDNFSVRSLQALQSVLQGSNQPMLWKEGEVEKKAEMAAKRRAERVPDSDSD